MTDPEFVGHFCGRPMWRLSRRLLRREVTVREAVLAACTRARAVLPTLREGAALAAIETTERWCRGEASLDEVIAVGFSGLPSCYSTEEGHARTSVAYATLAYASDCVLCGGGSCAMPDDAPHREAMAHAVLYADHHAVSAGH